MFIDEVVLAGILTVGLMVAFFGGVGYFIWKDSHSRKGSSSRIHRARKALRATSVARFFCAWKNTGAAIGILRMSLDDIVSSLII